MLIDVAVPEMALPPLTYSTDTDIPEGARVIVEVQRSLHAGFVLGETQRDVGDAEIKPVAGIIDDRLMTDPDIWDLAKWAGKVCLCGMNTALRFLLPKIFWTGERVEAPPYLAETRGQFREVHNFNPFDAERVNFYAEEMKCDERVLILFSSREAAQRFYRTIAADDVLFWKGSSDWEAVNTKKFRVVVGTAGAVSAPLSPQKIIVDDEDSPNYITPYGLRISARSLAGHRASFLGATLILGGRMPSLKTYMRAHPSQTVKPDRRNIILADIWRSRKEEAQGIDGQIPLTFSLIRRTYTELLHGNNVVWILSRTGTAREVYCEKCGAVLKCVRCGSVMRSFGGGELLKCPMCGSVRELPEKCECGRRFFRGRRPGIEALAEIVSRYYPKVKLYDKNAKHNRGLILATRSGLDVVEKVDVSLIAWVDLDLELWGDDYDKRRLVFSMLYRSLYAGSRTPRKVLVQARRTGLKLAEYLLQGWEKFLAEELRERDEFMMPPCGYMIEIDTRGKIARETLIDILEDNGLFVMDPGDETKPLYVNTDRLDDVSEILEQYSGMLSITVRSE
ncbi:MAG: hypothetical protein IJT02_07855 [Synergistaceae bacterium]|nr:hypothetical protein [Synergistaceae bacterium]